MRVFGCFVVVLAACGVQGDEPGEGKLAVSVGESETSTTKSNGVESALPAAVSEDDLVRGPVVSVAPVVAPPMVAPDGRDRFASRIARIGLDRVAVVRGRVVSLSVVEETPPSEVGWGDGPSIVTVATVAIDATYCGRELSGDVPMRSFGGRLPTGRAEWSSDLGYQLAIDDEGVFALTRSGDLHYLGGMNQSDMLAWRDGGAESVDGVQVSEDWIPLQCPEVAQ